MEYFPADDTGETADYIHYLDNGEDFSYETGDYNLYHFQADTNGQLTTHMEHDGCDIRYDNIHLNIN